jgi:hypothetical protein
MDGWRGSDRAVHGRPTLIREQIGTKTTHENPDGGFRSGAVFEDRAPLYDWSVEIPILLITLSIPLATDF